MATLCPQYTIISSYSQRSKTLEVLTIGAPDKYKRRTFARRSTTRLSNHCTIVLFHYRTRQLQPIHVTILRLQILQVRRGIQAAACVIRSDSVFGAFYRRKRSQLGPRQAQVATAHKIARTVYHLLKYKTPYHAIGAEAYEQKSQERELAHVRKKAAKLGSSLMVAT